MPSAVVLSIVIHVALFLLAGMLVVFTVVKKEEQKFEPPKAVDRPKMKLKKPKVKVKKSAKPKSTTRIVTKMNRASMPDIQLPEMSGMGEGLDAGLGGFDMMPDLGEVSVFGSGQSIGNDFIGTFYDFTRSRNGRKHVMDTGKFITELSRFVKSGWNPSILARYYRSPSKRYTTTFTFPPTLSSNAAEAFGEPPDDERTYYCVALHYKGQLVHPEDIRFRFWGLGSEAMVVRVDGKTVLNAAYPRDGGEFDTAVLTPMWQTRSADSRKYWMGINLSVVGDWITLKAGEPVDMEVLCADVIGTIFQSVLCVEVEGGEYERSPDRGGPILPIFKTSPVPIDLMEAIHADLNPGDACVTNGSVFSDFVVPERTKPYYDTGDSTPAEPNLHSKSDYQKPRAWSLLDGRTLDAEFITVIGGRAVLKNAKGKQLKIPADQLSPEDRLHMDLADPPDFLINFSKTSRFVPAPKPSPVQHGMRPLKRSDYTFGTELKQRSTGSYPHELHVEFFAIGAEIDGDNYVLLDRQSSKFTPSKENGGCHSFHSPEPIRLTASAMRDASPMRGTKYGGFLITVTDERGEIIQYKTSGKWLFENIENLKNLPVGKHFDKRGIRVGPPRPTQADRPSWI